MLSNRTVNAAAWALGMLVVLVLAVMGPLRQGFNFRADVLALLPAAEQAPDVQRAIERMSSQFENTVLLVLKPGGEAIDRTRLANELSDAISTSGLFEDPPPMADAFSGLAAFRYQLLDPQTRAQIEASPDGLLNEATRAAYGLNFGAAPFELGVDPLQLHSRYVASMLPSDIEPVAGSFLAVDSTVFTSLQLAGSAFDAVEGGRLLNWIDVQSTWAEANGWRLLVSGVPRFAAVGAADARQEISTFGSLSIVGVVLLMVAVFRSPLPLLATLTCIGVGMAAGLVVTHTWFGEVHLITLVFGMSLIGISVDYALHFLCDRLRDDGYPAGALTAVAPGITLALASTILAFASLAATPFPGLQQISVFSASGLFAAWLTVIGVLPWLPLKASANAAAAARWLQRWPQGWPHVPQPRILGAAAAIALALGLIGLTASDDVRTLQALDPILVAEDAEARGALPGNRVSQFFLVRGSTETELLAREQTLRTLLENVPHTAVSTYYPDRETQAANRALIETSYFASGTLEAWYAQLGADPSLFAQVQQAFAKHSGTQSLVDWSRSAPPNLAQLVHGCESSCTTVVALHAADEPEALADLASQLPGVTWVDPADQISSVLSRYRVLMSWTLAAVGAVISVLLLWRFGLNGGLRVVAVPLLAVATAFAVNGLVGTAFSVFTLLAAMIIAGISLDYGIFYHLHGRERPTTTLAISLSAATTVLAFGMLSFSSTAVVATLGQTLAVGLTTAFIIAPLAAQPRQSRGSS